MFRGPAKLMKIPNAGNWSRLLCGGTILALLSLCGLAQAAPKHVLVVTTTTGFRHSSIPTAEKVIAELGKRSGAFTVEYARVEPTDPQFRGPNGKPDQEKVHAAIAAVLAKKMSPEALKHYDAVIFANTTGDLPIPDKQAFVDWVKSGKGFVGMHAATDTFHHFPGYIDMIGGEFKTHAHQLEVQPINQDPECPACACFGPGWKVYDEIYQMKSFDPAKVHGLLRLEHKPDVTNPEPGYYPISWCKEYGKGRVFYTSLGHREDVWDPNWSGDRMNSKAVSEAYQQHILNGIKWALGLEQWNLKPHKMAQ